jgi:chemotaxis protein CheZ
MSNISPEHVTKVIEFLRSERKSEDVSLEDVMQLAELMAEGFQQFFKSMDTAIYVELGAMAKEIANMKDELSRLQLTDMRNEHIPTAGRELDAIVEATEEATNTIMSAAEEIMSADPDKIDAFQILVGEKVIEIFQACSFQDITGQRISKVVTTLNALDTRITTLVEKLKIMKIKDVDVDETDSERRARELMLHGPQFKGEGVSQDDIDALF